MINKFIILLVLVIGLFSCAKPGCTDKNADTYNSEATKNDNSCMYRYMNYTKIIMPYAVYAVADTKTYIKLFKKSDSSTKYVSDTVTTLNTSTFQFKDQFYVSNEAWTMQVWVVDGNSNQENVISTDFNPFELQPTAAQNVIKFNTNKDQNLYQVSMYYTVKK
jgi:hypothetical protein